jgi:hypothetical protein
MPVTPNTKQPPATAPKPTTPHDGAWVQDPNTHAFTWSPHATPDPGLVRDWGYGPMTDIRQDPTGVRNHGAWTPVHGGGWSWTWGANPDPNLARTYGTDALTDPDHTPNHADAHGKNTPPPPDVTAPTLTDTWKGVAPDVTGEVPPEPQDDTHGNLLGATEPPPHSAFHVSPGSIRDVESLIASGIDTQIDEYEALKRYAEASYGQNLYMEGTREQIRNTQDRLLLAVGDVVTLAGQYNEMLNRAAQSYARADLDSFLPGS